MFDAFWSRFGMQNYEVLKENLSGSFCTPFYSIFWELHSNSRNSNSTKFLNLSLSQIRSERKRFSGSQPESEPVDENASSKKLQQVYSWFDLISNKFSEMEDWECLKRFLGERMWVNWNLWPHLIVKGKSFGCIFFCKFRALKNRRCFLRKRIFDKKENLVNSTAYLILRAFPT